MAYRIRSAGLPSSPRSKEIDIDEQLSEREDNNLPIICYNLNMCDGFRNFGIVYDCISELVYVPGRQVTRQRKALDQELECSLVLLALQHRTMQQGFGNLRGTSLTCSDADGPQERRRPSFPSHDPDLQPISEEIAETVKKDQQDVHFRFAAEQQKCRFIEILSETREIAISMLETLLHLLTKQIDMPNS